MAMSAADKKFITDLLAMIDAQKSADTLGWSVATQSLIPKTPTTMSSIPPIGGTFMKAFGTSVEDVGDGWFFVDLGEYLMDLPVAAGDRVVIPEQQFGGSGSKMATFKSTPPTEQEGIEELFGLAMKDSAFAPAIGGQVGRRLSERRATLSLAGWRKELNGCFGDDDRIFYFEGPNNGWGLEAWQLGKFMDKYVNELPDLQGFHCVTRYRFPIKPVDPTEYIERAKHNITRLTRKPLPPAVPITMEILDKAILPEETKEEIVSVLKQYQNASQLFEEWGLGEVIEYGRGMIFLFWGGPGTGKTFTANLMAKALGKPLMTLGAAELESSTPGEYERNVAAAFEEAKKKKSVLFFDECDGMIQSRTGMGQIMSGQNNKFLQEIEKFEGVVVMATNRVDSLDEALERRISLIVEFKHPDQPQREQIFTRMIPSKMPLDKNVELAELAAHYLSGGEIKNVVLNAARFAASRASSPDEFKKLKVNKADFLKAIERVMAGRKAFDRPRNTGHVQQGGKTIVRGV